MPPGGPPGSDGGAIGLPGGSDSQPSGSGGDTRGSGTPDGPAGSSGGASDSGSGGTLPPGIPGGWETSNELPPPVEPRPAPPMPGKGTGSGGDQELEEALGAFDGEILAEREVLEQRSNESPSGSGGAGNGLPGGAAPAGSGSGQSGAPKGGGVMPAPPSRPTPPMPRGQAPDDIPDARDDDIIARQLREAAMAETDPELREALWEEYRRYKGS